MTETTWLNSTDPLALLDHLFPMRSLDSTEPQPRKSRLYLVACARRAWDHLPWVCRALAEIAEDVADNPKPKRRLREAAYAIAEELTHGRGEPDDIAEAELALANLGHRNPNPPAGSAPYSPPKHWTSFAHLAYFPFARETPYYRRVAEEFHSAELVREVFGNPFRRIVFDPQWRTDTVTGVATGVYRTRDFSGLPVLADALQDAGCPEAAILDHCRGPGPHARGCWVLDMILGYR